MSGKWGPGWLSDVFDIDVTFDNEPPKISDGGAGGEGEVFCDPWYAYDGTAYLFCGNQAAISGAVTLTTSGDRSVDHFGVNIRIEEYIHFLDPYVQARLKSVQQGISEKATVEGIATYPFSIPLSSIREADTRGVVFDAEEGKYPNLTHWLNTYNGNSFAVRHIMIVEVYRPWYTFNVFRYRNLNFQMMENANNQNCIKFPPNSSDETQSASTDISHMSISTLMDSPDEMKRIVPEIVHVKGLAGDGKCRMKLHSTHINLARSPLGYGRGGEAGDGAIIRGTLELSNLETPVVSAKCMLLRAEYVGSKLSHDALECEHLLLGVDSTVNDRGEDDDDDDDDARIPRSKGYVTRQDVLENGLETPRFIDPVKTGSTIAFEICLDGSGVDDDERTNTSSTTKRVALSHEKRIENSMWKNLAYQLNPTFYYLPLDLSEEYNEKQDAVTVPAPLPTNQSKDSTLVENESASTKIYQIDSDESVCLRYFLRLVLEEKSGKKFWETAELVFFYSPRREESMQKNAFLSARNNHATITVVPPYAIELEEDTSARKNEKV